MRRYNSCHTIRKAKFSIVLGALTLLLPLTAGADSLYKSTVRVGQSDQLLSLRKDRPGFHNLSRPIKVSFSIRGKGHFTGSFNRYQRKSWGAALESGVRTEADTTDVTLLRGKFSERRSGKNKILTGSLYENRDGKVLNILFEGGGRTKRLYHLSGPLAEAGETVLRVNSVPKNLGNFCGDKAHVSVDEGSGGSVSDDVVNPSAATQKVLTISTDADFEYYNIHKENTNAHIATVINAASALYEEQMGIRLEIGTQHAFTSSAGSPYTSSSSETLLEQFLGYTEANQHLGVAHNHFLFSGKRWEGNVAGIAYVGVTCSYPDAAYGATRSFSAPYDALVLAHELGHNLGADHDEATSPATIMYPALMSATQNKFSSTSKNQMNAHLAKTPSCLGQTTVTPTPIPTVAPRPDPRTPDKGIGTRVAASTTRDGTFTISINSEESDEGCTLSLLGGTNKADFSTGKAVSLYSMSLSAETVSFQGRIARQSATPVYLQSTISCPEIFADSFSRVVSLKLNKVQGRRVSGKGWLSLFKRIEWE